MKKNKDKNPDKWIMNNLSHISFAEEVIISCGKILGENTKQLKKGNKIAEKLLPFSKNIAIKAIYFILDHLYTGNLLEDIPDKKEYARKLNINKAILDHYIIDRDKEKSLKNDLLLIDWRTSSEWIAEMVRSGNDDFKNGKTIEDALICMEQAKKNSNNQRETKEAEGILHLTLAEFYKKRGNKKLASKHIKKSISLGNKEAKK
jgi:hypothetical protein